MKQRRVRKIRGASLMSKALLIEIGHEELPADFVSLSAEQLSKGLTESLANARVDFKEVRYYATPRRTAVVIKDVPEKSKVVEKEVVGPPKNIAFDSDGNPTKALFGFVKKLGISVRDVEVKKTSRGEYVYGVVKEGGKDTREILREVLPRVIQGMNFPKTMRWEGPLRFPRPIRWLVVLYGNEVVHITINSITSDRITRGNRLATSTSIAVNDPEEYVDRLRDAFVIVDIDERKKIIRNLAQEKAKSVGGYPVEDDDLVTEVANLLEYPVAVVGRYDSQFLKLPPPVVITAMRQHQRYFAVLKENGNLLPYFIAFINNPHADIDKVRAGLEEVLLARLEDALFYYEVDTKRKLIDRLEDLKGITWFPGLGTVYEKVMRTSKLADYLADKVENIDKDALKRASLLYKADLSTEMIKDGKEFTKLEGLIGMYYALAEGEKENVAKIIYESHLPRISGDNLPSLRESALLGIADRVDSIVAILSSGYQVTGAQDPMGLRRLAYTLIDLLLNFQFHFDLKEIVEQTEFSDDSKKLALDFILTRFENYLEEKLGIRYDIVDAVIGSGITDLNILKGRAEYLFNLSQKDPDRFEKIVIGQKRVANILKGVKDLPDLSPEMFRQSEEKALYDKILEIKQPYIEALVRNDYERALSKLSQTLPLIDNFFDNVFVMVDDKDLRMNRLTLLSLLRKLFLKFADFSRVVLPGSSVNE